MEKTRKRWVANTEITPELIKSREKRKWQIALRRYVVDRNPCTFYAPYFGLDIQSIRDWCETQFEPGVGWADFGKKWQLDHVIPVTYFDFDKVEELKLCWNFINIRVENLQNKQTKGNHIDLLVAKGYFEGLFQKTRFDLCLRLQEKIRSIELSELLSDEKQATFIVANKNYLDIIEDYSGFEFELLNSGRNTDDVKKEIDLLKKLTK